MADVKIGVIGGSGLYQMEGLKLLDERYLETPFGRPSDAIIIGELEGQKIAFLPRHGRGHVLTPSEINYRANIFALKTLGVERILSVSAVGSMKEEIAPGDVVLIDQFIDRTRQRPSTFFGEGIVAHVAFADPICPNLLETVMGASKDLNVKVHKGGTYLCMEGPMFSTKAESNLYRSWGVDVIGMTNLQEAKLAREAEICYCTLAMPTDYDCWHATHAAVDVAMVVETLQKNVTTAKQLIQKALRQIGEERRCACATALKDAILTDRSKISAGVKQRLAPIIGKYV
ncbi:MAG: S-methyl-5'-thioadenosine phosphorylase [Deltaproteobacteria bacterium]|nr:S-methyl-5'-thioadenosine phosphorylase [Deltaproteobacteria bacterium]